MNHQFDVIVDSPDAPPPRHTREVIQMMPEAQKKRGKGQSEETERDHGSKTVRIGKLEVGTNSATC
jgi:hypothetical protein